ncbi:hypothetical protein CLAIMM_02327 [Cladophialophora immunda]|nr:hypothetical protein CLAIMM_02327 [Cladophialophora immunda]
MDTDLKPDTKATVAEEHLHIEVTDKHSFDEHAEVVDKKAERALKLKSDFLILPIMSLTYLIAYMDRNNLGNAKIMTFTKDTHLTSKQFYNCLTIFYVGYLTCMLAGNLALRAWGPDRTIGGACVFFGAIVCGLSQAKNYGSVMALRVLVGCGEAFIQGGGLYLSLWYSRHELATRAAIYYSTSTISGCFSGLIAYGVQKGLDGTHGMSSWQWLFLVEGIPSIAVGILILLLLPQFPDRLKKHWLFTEDEIALAVSRASAYNVAGAKIKWSDVLRALREPKTYMVACIYGGVGMGSAAVGNFLPSIIKSFGYSAIHSQLFTVIPYACATVSLVAVNYVSDRFRRKGIFVAGCLVLSIVGYIILMTITNNAGRIVATCLVVSGIYPAIILVFSWANTNSCGYTKRATSWAVAGIFAQCFSIAASQVYTDPPRYLKGHGVMLAFLSLSLINTLALYLWMKRANAKKEEIELDYRQRGIAHPHYSTSLEDEGDGHIKFRYVL